LKQSYTFVIKGIKIKLIS